MAEAVRDRRGSTIEFADGSLDSVPISVRTHLKSKADSSKCGLEVSSAIDEKHGGLEVMLLPKFAENEFSESRHISTTRILVS